LTAETRGGKMEEEGAHEIAVSQEKTDPNPNQG